VSTHLYKPHRSCGTLIAYHKHRIIEDIYSNVGEQDITAHVNFSALQYFGEKSGLTTCGMAPQAYFLLSLGFRECLERTMLQQNKNMLQAVREMALINHTLLFDMGHKFKVLIQSKGLPPLPLSGLKVPGCGI
jgi:SAM-dependent MidA family methyltransferase